MKKYQIIYADPPWSYKVYSKKGLGRSAESHYPTMCIEDICAHLLWEKAEYIRRDKLAHIFCNGKFKSVILR